MELPKIFSLLEQLNEEGVEYVVFGGVALNFHGVSRATVDIDLFVNPSGENVDRLKKALRRIWSDPAIEEISATELAGNYPSVQYGPPGEVFSIDIVARLGEAFRFDQIESEVVELAGLSIPVATPEMLYRMKRDTVRPKDRADAAALRELFELEEK
jgi:hypothetical protein